MTRICRFVVPFLCFVAPSVRAQSVSNVNTLLQNVFLLLQGISVVAVSIAIILE